MKKTIAAIILVSLLLASLSGCQKKVKCDFCAEEKKCSTTTLWGEEVHICDDCETELHNLFG